MRYADHVSFLLRMPLSIDLMRRGSSGCFWVGVDTTQFQDQKEFYFVFENLIPEFDGKLWDLQKDETSGHLVGIKLIS